MTAERSGSCSTAVAPLEVVEEEEGVVAALVPEALALAEEEVDTGNRVSVKQVKNETQKDDRDH